MKNQNIFNEFEALNQAELENTFGGESAWYWIAYGVGAAYTYISNYEQSSGSKVMNTALH
jgi:hypothetical protein